MFPTPRPFDEASAARAGAHFEGLREPAGSLGKIEHLARWWCGTAGVFPPIVPERARLYVFAGDHGVAAEGGIGAAEGGIGAAEGGIGAAEGGIGAAEGGIGAAEGGASTAHGVGCILSGRAALNVIARHHRVEVVVVDVGLAAARPLGPEPTAARYLDRNIRRGTGNMAREPALDPAEVLRAIEVGAACATEAAQHGVSILGVGELGRGGTTAAAAVLAAVTGMPGKLVAGRGAGLDDAGLARKIDAIDRALALHDPPRDDGVAILAAVGGTEIAAIAGLCLGGASVGVPVVLDGFVATAGGLLAAVLSPAVLPFLLVSHRSAEKAHWAMSRYLQKEPVHDLELHIGEGAGAVLAIDTVRIAAKLLVELGGPAPVKDRS